jgi:hypothetical protein
MGVVDSKLVICDLRIHGHYHRSNESASKLTVKLWHLLSLVVIAISYDLI